MKMFVRKSLIEQLRGILEKASTRNDEIDISVNERFDKMQLIENEIIELKDERKVNGKISSAIRDLLK